MIVFPVTSTAVKRPVTATSTIFSLTMATNERWQFSSSTNCWISQGTSPSLTGISFTFTATNADEIFHHTAHGLITGDGPFQVSNSGGALPAGITALTNYWPIVIDVDTFFLATSLANALAATHLSITTDGTGTQTFASTASTIRASIPVAQIANSSTFVGAGVTVMIDGTVGADLAVIRDTADGNATMTRCKLY